MAAAFLIHRWKCRWKNRLLVSHIRNLSRLSEVGQFVAPKVNTQYECGQLFLHRVFGYRGVILFPWLARVYDRDLEAKADEKSADEGNFSNIGKEVKGETHAYYQVFVDNRDSPFIRSQPDQAVTFLGGDSDISLYAVPGLDYSSHEDILPYTTTEPKPIQHELFERFLLPDFGKVPPFVPRDALKAWHVKNHNWLELSDVHKETTENIRVTVIPFFMGSRKSEHSDRYWWRYCIRLENLGQETVHLRERHWRVFSLSGTLETIRGRGVVGQEPVLSSDQPAFQYSSHVSLYAPSGHMWGTFRFESQNGHMFDVRIPPFCLESKDVESTGGLN